MFTFSLLFYLITHILSNFPMNGMCIFTALSGAGLTNRKFNAGKQAKKLAETMSIQKEFQRQQQALQAQQAESKGGSSSSVNNNNNSGGGGDSMSTDAVMQSYREKRGGTLMEQHLAKHAKTTAEKEEREGASQVGGKPARRAFDRERDLLSHSKMDQHKVAKLVENARELDSRFDKACVQKSFL